MGLFGKAFNRLLDYAQERLTESSNAQITRNSNTIAAFTPISDKSNEEKYVSDYELMFMRSINGKSANLSGLPQKWKYRYNLDVNATAKKLLRLGYIEYAPIEYVITKRTLPDLKALLESKGLPTKGKKEQVIDRVLSDFTPVELSKALPEQYYRTTALGNSFLEEAEFIDFFASSNYEISLEEAKSERSKRPEFSEYDIALVILSRRANKAISTGRYSHYRAVALSLADINQRLGDTFGALTTYFDICAIDLSGLKYDGTVSEDNSIVAPGIVAAIYGLLDQLNMDYSTAREHYIARIKDLNLPNSLYSIYESWERLFEELSKTEQFQKSNAE